MKLSSLLTVAGMALGVLAGDAKSGKGDSDSDLPPIEVVGNKFFYTNNGSQFFVKGVAYQENVANKSEGTHFKDPLADGKSCKRDIEYLQKLGTNLIRVYAINTTQDHSECMEALQKAGIYVIADLSEPGLSIQREDSTWDVELYKRYTSVVDTLHKYKNVMGFFGGNEVVSNKTDTPSAAFVKAAIRDTKAYIKEKGYRTIPVGYSANDDPDTREDSAKYFACGSEEESADFYGINMYEWCGESSFESSGYKERTEEFKNLGIPIFFSEYGCNSEHPRKFTEVGTLYGDKMTDVWSGGIVYMYFQEENDYGLVSIKDDKVSTLGDFSYLSKELAKISPSSAKTGDVTGTRETVKCPAATGKSWKANSKLPPSPNQGVCDCVSNAAKCVVADDVKEKDYGKLFGYICGEIDCSGTQANGTKGEYGAYSGCDGKAQLNFLLDLYYKKNKENKSACDFKGSASVVDSPKTPSSCKSILSEAGTAGTGSVSASVTGTYGGAAEAGQSSSGASKAGSSGSGSSSSGGSSDAGSINANGVRVMGGASFALALALMVVV
ncbi:hypothetical protein TRICI_006596 [Trichomonascus ciferrii]|uniref:1,3-beta-glucanosyltransferase n=1 Tax=Trichomonascus ciferrii TaxID=44093 RepID=A0A642UFZ7_9ASCO|nr:hypothetical protein TRICI_006596 [Trichomonascus ciferrii]